MGMLSPGLVSLFCNVGFQWWNLSWRQEFLFNSLQTILKGKLSESYLGCVYIQQGDQKISHPPSRLLFAHSECFLQKPCGKKTRKKNCLYIQTWAKLAGKIAVIINRTDQHTSSALGWSLIATLYTTKIKPTVTFLLEAGGTSLVAFMKKGVRVGGKVTRGWSEPCCEWWLRFPKRGVCGWAGRASTEQLTKKNQKNQNQKTKKH